MTNIAENQGADDELFELMGISVDVEARDNGAWIKGTKHFPKLELKVLGTASPTITALEIALEKERPDNFADDPIVRMERNRYENRKKAMAGLLDWKPFNIRGVLTAFSPEKKKELVHHKNFERFVVAILHAMDAADIKQLEWENTAEKNSGDGSGENSGSSAKEAAAA